MAFSKNRISDLLPEPKSPSKPSRVRTEAQRKASRANGSKSRGPVTAAGKQRSSQNAIRHGLLSTKFIPPMDTRGDDVLFRRIQRQLFEELAPRSFIARQRVDALAHDMLQLARCRQLIEIIQCPTDPRISDEDRALYKRIIDVRHDLKSVRKLITCLDAKQVPNLPAGAAARVAERVVATMKELEEYFNGPDCTPYSEMGDEERSEYNDFMSRWVIIKPGFKKLLDRIHTSKILRGQTSLKIQERKQLRAALEQIIVDIGYRDNEDRLLEPVMRQAANNSLLALARDPNGLLLLNRYATKIENSIEKKIQALRRE